MESFARSVCNLTLVAATLALQPAFAGPGDHLAFPASAYAKLPLQFEANRGQTDEPVKFIGRARGHALLLAPGETVLKLGKREQTTVRTSFLDANPKAAMSGEKELPGKVNYFIGTDRAKWRTNVSTYARVRYEALYPGIDLVFHGGEGELEYDFVVAPGADPECIALRIEGAERLEVSPSGDLVMHTPGGVLRYRKPFIYQERDGGRQEIAGGYVVDSANRVGFKVASYDKTRALVIDPVIMYSTYIGAGTDADDYGTGIALDAAGNIYLTGNSRGPNLTTFWEAFVTKLNPDGTALLYMTYLGGSNEDYGGGIAVDASGNAYVAGMTRSNDFPTTAGAFQPARRGKQDIFVTKLSPDGALVYSTYLGGGVYSEGGAIAIDAEGNAYVTGRTHSADFPTTPGAFQAASVPGPGAFVTKINGTGTALVYSTYLRGTDNVAAGDGHAIAVDSAGNAYVAGVTSSRDFPTTPGAFQTVFGGGDWDAFVAKLNPNGTALAYSTFLGGNNREYAVAIAIDSAGDAYVTGATTSGNFPTTPDAFQRSLTGTSDAFVTKLNTDGARLAYSTYLGDNAGASGIAVDSAGNAYVTGGTSSANFPTTSNAFQRTRNGMYDAFVTKLNADGTRLAYSTYLGGGSGPYPGPDWGSGIVLDAYGNAYVTGTTGSNDFPVTRRAVRSRSDGNYDAFLVKFKFAATSADFNADGFSDLLWRNSSTGENYIYPMNGKAILGVEGYVRTQPDPNWKIVGIGDFDGDGKSDILWRNLTTGENYIYMMNGTAIANEGYIRSVADRNWQVAGVGDFDGDGKDDILWRNAATGENYLYLMSAFNITSEGDLRTVADTSWKVVAVADFDGDSKADILWRNATTGQNYVYPMNGTAIKTTEGYLRTVASQNWQVAGVADLDGDGKADIVWRNAATGENYLYPMDGTIIKPSEAYFRTVADLNWQIAALGDYDGDGKSDLVWRNSSTGENYLYPMDGSTIKSGEGYFRTVPETGWQIQKAR